MKKKAVFLAALFAAGLCFATGYSEEVKQTPLFLVQQDGKYGFIDNTGKAVIDTKDKFADSFR